MSGKSGIPEKYASSRPGMPNPRYFPLNPSPSRADARRGAAAAVMLCAAPRGTTGDRQLHEPLHLDDIWRATLSHHDNYYIVPSYQVRLFVLCT